MHSQTTKDIVKKLSLKYRLPISEIEKIIMVPQDIMYVMIKSGDPFTISFNNTYIPGFGKFVVTKKKLDYLTRHNEKALAKYKRVCEKHRHTTKEEDIQVMDTSE